MDGAVLSAVRPFINEYEEKKKKQPLNLGAALGMHPRVEPTRGAQLHNPAAREPAKVSGLGKDVDCDKWQRWCSKGTQPCKLQPMLAFFLQSQQSDSCQ